MATYIIRAGASGPVKIGRAVNVLARRDALQTAHYEDLRILAIFRDDIELKLHGRFAGLRIRGEWFHYDDAMLSIDVQEVMEPKDNFEKLVAEYRAAIEAPREENGTEAERLGLTGVVRDLAAKHPDAPNPAAVVTKATTRAAALLGLDEDLTIPAHLRRTA